MPIYDSLSNSHFVGVYLIKVSDNTWKVLVDVDQVARGEGRLVFDASGKLIKQNGLRHILWPAEYGMHELKMDLKDSTQQEGKFFVFTHVQNGYRLGKVIQIAVSQDGDIFFRYNNGQVNTVKGRIAIAMFTNPKYLEPVTNHMYIPTEKSGQPIIHWTNGEGAVLSGFLEEGRCIVG